MAPVAEFILALAALVILIIGLTNLSVWIGRREPENEKEQDRRRDHENRERYAKPQKTDADAIATRVESLSDQLYAQGKEQARHERKRTLLEVVGVTAAIAAAVFALWSAWIFSGQLEEMQNDQRPWVSANTQINAGLTYDINGANVGALLVLKNTGRSPAKDAAVYFEVYSVPTIGSGPGFRQKQVDACKTARGMAEHGMNATTIFPGDVNVGQHSGSISQEIITKLTAERHGLLHIAIIGCVDYQFASREGHHRTSFAYTLMRALPGQPNACCVFVIQQGDVPLENLRLYVAFEGGTITD